MIRMPRVVVPHYPHHVTQRGNRRQQTFFCMEDYRYYIDLVSYFAEQAATEIWAYCLMPNHVHLTMLPTYEDELRGVLEEVVSPLLANLFLHYAFDAWARRTLLAVPFFRYADDGLLHCRSESQARYVLKEPLQKSRPINLSPFVFIN